MRVYKKHKKTYNNMLLLLKINKKINNKFQICMSLKLAIVQKTKINL